MSCGLPHMPARLRLWNVLKNCKSICRLTFLVAFVRLLPSATTIPSLTNTQLQDIVKCFNANVWSDCAVHKVFKHTRWAPPVASEPIQPVVSNDFLKQSFKAVGVNAERAW